MSSTRTRKSEAHCEFHYPPTDEEGSFLHKFEENRNGVFFVTCAGPSVVGHLELVGGLHSQTKHVARLGTSVVKAERDTGVGRQ